MEIQINGCAIDVKLEDEKKVPDIVNPIVEWASERDLIFIEAWINDKNYLIDHLPDTPLDDINIINCIVQSRADVCIASLNEGIDYCNRVHSFIEESTQKKNLDISHLEPLGNGIDWIIEVINKLLQLLTLDVNEVKFKDKSINDYIGKLDDFKNAVIDSNDADNIIELFNDHKWLFSSFMDIFKMLLMSDNMKALVIKSIDSPDVLISSLLGIKNEIPEQLNNLEETAIAFQTGKDDVGSEKLQLFIDFIYRYSRTCYQVAPVFEIDLAGIKVDGISLDEKNSEIQNLLNEVLEVMENNDIISLSDILEYEIKAALENLGLYINCIVDYTTNKV